MKENDLLTRSKLFPLRDDPILKGFTVQEKGHKNCPLRNMVDFLWWSTHTPQHIINTYMCLKVNCCLHPGGVGKNFCHITIA